jgi:hypothetical protein
VTSCSVVSSGAGAAVSNHQAQSLSSRVMSASRMVRSCPSCPSWRSARSRS